MRYLNRFQKLIEWMMSLLCLAAAALLWVQRQVVEGAAMFAFSLAINPLMEVNILIKLGLAFLAGLVIFNR